VGDFAQVQARSLAGTRSKYDYCRGLPGFNLPTRPKSEPGLSLPDTWDYPVDRWAKKVFATIIDQLGETERAKRIEGISAPVMGRRFQGPAAQGQGQTRCHRNCFRTSP